MAVSPGLKPVVVPERPDHRNEVDENRKPETSWDFHIFLLEFKIVFRFPLLLSTVLEKIRRPAGVFCGFCFVLV